jgi:hypothetical protein
MPTTTNNAGSLISGSGISKKDFSGGTTMTGKTLDIVIKRGVRTSQGKKRPGEKVTLEFNESALICGTGRGTTDLAWKPKKEEKKESKK